LDTGARGGNNGDLDAPAPAGNKGDKDRKPGLGKKLIGKKEKSPAALALMLDEKKGADQKYMPIVNPGEKIGIKVQLRPYRRDLVEETIYLKVPRNIAPGNAIIDVFSGTKQQESISPADFLIKISNEEKPHSRDQETGAASEEKEKDKSFDELIKKFNKRDLNNELVATISSLDFSVSGDDDSDIGADNDNSAVEPAKRAKKQTQWVLEGSTSIKVKIAGNEEPASSPLSLKQRRIKKSKINTLREKK